MKKGKVIELIGLIVIALIILVFIIVSIVSIAFGPIFCNNSDRSPRYSYHYQDEAVVIYHEIEYEVNGNWWRINSDKEYVTVLEYKGVKHTYYDYNFFITYDKGDHVVIDVRDDYRGEQYREENVFYRDFSLASEDRRGR